MSVIKNNNVLGVRKTKKNKTANNSKNSGYNSDNSKDRKEKIFNLIKDKKEITVGELSGLFTGYSEKTLQRDLLEMTQKGVLKKQGDKRWRKYILAEI